MKVARDKKRNSIIYEVNQKYIEIIKNKVEWNNRILDSDARYEIKIRKPVTD